MKISENELSRYTDICLTYAKDIFIRRFRTAVTEKGNAMMYEVSLILHYLAEFGINQNKDILVEAIMKKFDISKELAIIMVVDYYRSPEEAAKIFIKSFEVTYKDDIKLCLSECGDCVDIDSLLIGYANGFVAEYLAEKGFYNFMPCYDEDL